MLAKEEWKEITGYKGYWVSSFGNVKRIYNNGKQRQLRPFKIKRYDRKDNFRGCYLQVSLSKNGEVKKFIVHRLVAMAFLYHQYSQGLVVNHKDGFKENNHVFNLEFISEKQNKEHAAKLGLMSKGESKKNSKLTATDVIDIIEKSKIKSQSKIAIEYGVSQPVISRIITKKIWRHVT